MIVDRIRQYLREFLDNIKLVLSETRSKVKNLEENNIDLAIDYFEYGVLNECKNRLKIVLRLWPNDNYAKYLIGLVYLLDRDVDKASKYFESVGGEKQKYARKLIDIINFNKIEKVIDAYKVDQNLYNLEGTIDNVKL